MMIYYLWDILYIYVVIHRIKQSCVQRSPLGNGKVAVTYRGTAIYRSTLQKILGNWKFWEVVQWQYYTGWLNTIYRAVTYRFDSVYMLLVKIKFRLKTFNLGWFSISFVPNYSLITRAKRQRKLKINLG